MSGYKHCITEEAADRQRQFENALLELMGTKLLVQISVQDICARLGLSRKAFYRYFSRKEECLHALIDHAVLDFTDLPVQGERLQPLLEQFFAYWGQRKPLLEALKRNDMSNLLFERAMDCAIQEHGIRDLFNEKNGNYERTIFFISGIFAVLLRWYEEGCQKTPAQLAVTLSEFLPPYPHGVF